jgi:inositol 1,4,5-triphosphate receptor type 1
VQRDLRRLSALVETEELWLGVDDSENRADETKEIVATLLQYCGTDEGTPKKSASRASTASPADKKAEERRRQSVQNSRPATAEVFAMLDSKTSRELLRNLGAHSAVMEVLQIERLLDVLPVGEELMQIAYHFLQAFGGSSKENREELGEFSNFFMEHLLNPNHNVVTAAAETLQVLGAAQFDTDFIKACFGGKGEPMEQVFEVQDPANPDDPEAKIALDQPCHNMACMDLLKQCLIVDNKYNRRHQNMVMKVAMDPSRLRDSPVQHKWLCERSFGVLEDHGFSEEAGVAASDVLRDPSNSALLDLLINCCQGGNGLMQAKCQGLFSLPTLAEHIEKLGKEFGAKRQLLEFMKIVYLEAAHGIDHELAHNTMFKIFTTDIELSLEDGVLDDEENAYIFEVLLPCIEAYFGNFADVLKANEEQINMAVTILSNIADLFETSESDKYKQQCQVCTKKMMESRQFFTTIFEDDDWQPGCERYEKLLTFKSEFAAEEDKEAEQDAEGEVEDSLDKKAPPSAFAVAMQALQENEENLNQAELEFEQLCQSIKDIEARTTSQFNETVITFEDVVGKQLELINDLTLETDLGRAGIKVLRKMIEMENDASTLPASEWENEDWEDAHDQVVEWQDKMGAMGAFQLVIALVGQHPDTDVVMDAIDLGVTLLLGGNKVSQDSFFEMSGGPGSLEFFRRLDALLQQSFEEMRDVNAAVVIEEDPEEEPEEEEDDGFDENKNAQIVFRFMQLMCEGHNEPCQGRMQAQPNTTSYDLVAKTQQILQLLVVDMASELDEDRMEAACQALDTLTEVVQGPCAVAQASLIENKVLDTATYIMSNSYAALEIPEGEDCHPLVMDLKEKTVTLLLSLLEGVTAKETYTLFAEILDLEVLRLRMVDVYGMCVEDPTAVADSRKIPEDIYFGDMNEAFGIYMLLSKLAKYSDEANTAIMASTYKEVPEQQAAINFFQGNTGCIEVDWETMDCLEQVHFPIPPIAWYLTEESRENLLVKVCRDSPEEKLRDWYTAWTDELMAEMEHLSFMATFRVVQFISENLGDLKSSQYVLALAINCCMVACMETTQDTDPTESQSELRDHIVMSSDLVELIMRILGYCLVAFTTFIGMGVAVTQGPLAVQNSWTRMIVEQGRPSETEVCPEENTVEMLLRWGPEPAGIYDDEAETGTKIVYLIISAYYLLLDSAVLWHLLMVVSAVLGCVVSPFFFSMHLLDVVYRSEVLLNVLRAVTIPGEQLAMTAALGIIILYIYSVLGFLLVREAYMHEDFPDERRCDYLLNCFLTTVREGLINGGGMADTFAPQAVSDKPRFIKRFIYDLSNFVVVIIILLNIIFGIIIDTFASMRESDDERRADMLNTCFICSIDKNTFDRGGTPFAQHIKTEHNMWEYLYYVVYLRQKDETEYTGIETYVADKLEEDDTSWYPTEKAICLGADEEEEDPWKVEVNERFNKLTEEFAVLKRSCIDIREESTNNVTSSMDMGKETIGLIDKIKVAYNPPSYDETKSWFSQTRAADEKATAEKRAQDAAERAAHAEAALAAAQEEVKQKTEAEARLLGRQAALEAEVAGAQPPMPADAWQAPPAEGAPSEGPLTPLPYSRAGPAIMIEPDEEEGEICPECGAHGMFKFCTECGFRNPNPPNSP